MGILIFCLAHRCIGIRKGDYDLLSTLGFCVHYRYRKCASTCDYRWNYYVHAAHSPTLTHAAKESKNRNLVKMHCFNFLKILHTIWKHLSFEFLVSTYGKVF